MPRMSAHPAVPTPLHSISSIPGLVLPGAVTTTSAVASAPPEPIDARVVVPAVAQCGVIICLDRVVSAYWPSVLADLKSVADALGLAHFVSRASVVAPYCEPNPTPPYHRHHLLNACRLAQTAQSRWPQFILAIIADHDTWQIVQHFGLMEYGVAVHLNAKLGGCNVSPPRMSDAMQHTLILGVAMAPVHGCRTPTFHCALVAAVDSAKHRWYTETGIQAAQTHRVINIGTMLSHILDMTRDPISRVIIVRDEIPPDDLDFVVRYETDQIKAVMLDRCNLEPRIAVAVPWDSLHDACSADDHTTVSVGSHPFAVPFNDFGGGWDTAAIGSYLASLAFDFPLDSRPTAWPVPLKYASAAASTSNVHYLEGGPKTLFKPLQGYKTLPRIIAQSPYWL